MQVHSCFAHSELVMFFFVTYTVNWYNHFLTETSLSCVVTTQYSNNFLKLLDTIFSNDFISKNFQ